MIKQRFNVLTICLLFLFALAILLYYLTPYPLYILAIPALLFELVSMLFQRKVLNAKTKNNSIQLYGSKSYGGAINLAMLVLLVLVLILQLFDLSDTRGWFWILLISTGLIKDLISILNWYIMIDKDQLHFNSLWKRSILISDITDVQLIKEGKIEIKLGEKIVDAEINTEEIEAFFSKINEVRSSFS